MAPDRPKSGRWVLYHAAFLAVAALGVSSNMQPPFALSTATRRNGGNKKGSVPTVEGTRRSARHSGKSTEKQKAARDKATRLKRKEEGWNPAHFGTEVTGTRKWKQSELALDSSSSSNMAPNRPKPGRWVLHHAAFLAVAALGVSSHMQPPFAL